MYSIINLYFYKIDDQICLLINSWCELLLFSCCYRSIDTPGEIKMSQGKTVTLVEAKLTGFQVENNEAFIMIIE